MSENSTPEETKPLVLPTVAEDKAENKTPTEEEQQQKEKTFFEIQRDKYEDLYNKRIVEHTKKSKVTFKLRKPTGRTIPDPLDENKQIPEYSGIETKDYVKGIASTHDYKVIEKLRALWNKARDVEDPTEDDIIKAADAMEKMYKHIAYVYLGMPAEEFERADWEEIRPELDSCTFKTNFFVPNTEG